MFMTIEFLTCSRWASWHKQINNLY